MDRCLAAPQKRGRRRQWQSHRLFFIPSRFVLNFLWFAIFLWLLIPGHASAKSRPRLEAENANVMINRQRALRFAVGHGDSSPEGRATTVVERLREQSLVGLTPGMVQARGSRKQWRIVVVGRTVLLSVTTKDARTNGSSPKALAMRWAGQIRQALAVPPVTLKPGRLVIPLGENRTLKLAGYDEGAFSSRITLDPKALTLESDPSARTVTLHASKPGKAVVRVRVGETEAACVVVVKKWAGKIPTDLTAEVTGSPAATPELISAAAAASLRRAPREPGASLTVLTPLRTHRLTPPGQSQTLTARIVLKGRDYLPRTGLAKVRVVNRNLPARQAARLFYSNTPEHILRTGTLYAAALSDSEPARIMFHHDNQMRGATVLSVTLTNPTEADQRVHILAGFVAPGGDPPTVGYRAGKVFLRNWMKHRGEIITVPARSTLPLIIQRLSPRMTASGIAQLRMVEPTPGTACVVRIAASAPTRTGFPRSVAAHLDPWRYTEARKLSASELIRVHAEATAQPIYRAGRSLDARYVVGDRWAFVPIGRDGIHAADPQDSPEHKDISGDYGVLYNIRVTMQNPLATSQRVQVFFVPGGGAAMAVFNIEGRYLELDETRPSQQRSIAQYTLRPNETRTVNIQTVPLGGSSYPANVIIR